MAIWLSWEDKRNEVLSISYNPFGEVTLTGDVEYNPHRPGQYQDSDFVYYNGYRYFEPATGRYLQPEPIFQNPQIVQAYAVAGYSLKAYAYAANNPLRFVDPTGLIFLGTNPAVDKALYALEHHYGKRVGAMVKELRESPDIVIDFLEVQDPGEELKNAGGALSECRPRFAIIRYNRDYAASFYLKKAGLSLTFDQLIAHELGHVWSVYKGFDFQTSFAQTAVDWENMTRGRGPFLKEHL